VKPLAVVPTYLRSPEDLEVALTAIASLRSSAPEADVLVVDDGSPATHLVDELEMASLGLESEVHRKQSNDGFSITVNVGLNRARDEGRDVVLVNADVEFFEGGWLERMVRQERSDGDGLASVVGARLLYPNGLIQHAGVYFSILTRSFGHIYQYGPGDLPEALSARRCPVTAALMFIRHECLEAVGVYDEHFQMGFEDVDYCLRTFKSGRECVYQPLVRAFHHESLFRGRPSPKLADWQARSFIYLNRKYAGENFVQWVPAVV
jgi:GT2 family glycosyltransferase